MLAISLAALVVVAWAAVAVLFPPARVSALIRDQLARTLAREVSFEDAAVALWPPVRLRVRGLKLAEPGGFARGAALETPALDLDLDVLALLGRRLVVRRLVLDRPALHLVLGADGSTNFEGLAREAPPGTRGAPAAAAAPLDLAVRELRIVDARVLVDDFAARRRIAFGVGSKLGFSLERGGERIATEGETRVSDLAFGPLSAARLADLNRSLGAIEWRIAHRGKYDAPSKRLALERLALGAGKAEIALSGVVDNVPGPLGVDMRAQGANVDLAEVLQALAAADARALHGVTGAGRLDFDLGVRGPLAPGRVPEVTGSLAVVNGAFRYPGAPAGVDAIAFTARFAPDSLGIGDLAARVAGRPLRGTLAVTHFADPAVRFTLAADVDLAAISPLVAPKDTKLGGRVGLDVRGRGRAKEPDAIALEGRARLDGVSVESPALPKKIEQIGGDLAFSPARAELRGLSVHAGQSSFTLDGTMTRPLAALASPSKTAPADVDFTLRSPGLDLGELLPVAPGSPVLPNVRGGGRVEIARLRKEKLDVENVTARLVLSPQVVEVPEFTLDGYGGTVRGLARFDVRDPARPGYVIKARVDSVEADRLLSAWTPARGLLHGALNTTLDLSGEGSSPRDLKRTLTAVGLAAVANGVLGPGPAFEALAELTRTPELKQVRFQDLKLPFRVERGRMITDPVVLKGSNGEWRLSGGIGFDGSLDYAVSTTLPPDVVKKLGAAAALAEGALADREGRVLLDLRVTGSARSPRVDWDRKAMSARAAGRLSEALEEQRKRLEAGLRESLAPPATAGDSAGTKPLSGRALEDSLKRAARDLFKGFFGGGKRDTSRH
ncbi:MAG TPA: AsmA-like C-terminal region-containing protein [Candidatus Eisenbacteria bacterium]